MKKLNDLHKEIVNLISKKSKIRYNSEYAVFNRISRQRKAEIYSKYLSQRIDELYEQIELITDVRRMTSYKN
jgi:hypothetical protein